MSTGKRGKSNNFLIRILSWLVSLACFTYLYWRISSQAPENISVLVYLSEIFASVNWMMWLGIMIPYSLFYLLVDTAVLWRTINWFNAKAPYSSLLPIRASAYIISIINEQIGKGTMALYLNKRYGVAGWELGSTMLFIMFCEFFYLLIWALIGVLIAWEFVPKIFHEIPLIAIFSFLFLTAFIWVFRSKLFKSSSILNHPLLKAFRESPAGFYVTVMLIRSPALIAAVWVYSMSASLFGVEIPFSTMLGFLPIIFFGALIPGPFRAVAVTLWPILFPENIGTMSVFGFVQHNFFLLFNATIGLVFLKKVNDTLFGGKDSPIAD